MINLFASEYTDTIYRTLEIFWQGMLAILIVIGLIFLVTYLMVYFTPDAIKKRQEKQAQKLQNPDADVNSSADKTE